MNSTNPTDPRVKKYGHLPIDMGQFNIECNEMMFYQYMPIKLAGVRFDSVEDRIRVFDPLLTSVYEDLGEDKWIENNIYITAKHIFVNEDKCGNRPGWHCDGFMTDDLNYIWCDAEPTVFSDCGLIDLVQDCDASLKQMEDFVNYSCEVTYPVNTLLKLDQYVIHRTPENCKPGFRTFVKISVSKDKYNLLGNTKNHLLKYNWDMVKRSPERNHPTK